jgi:hypothetical protein
MFHHKFGILHNGEFLSRKTMCMFTEAHRLRAWVLLGTIVAASAYACFAQATQPPAPVSLTKLMGTIKSISGKNATLTTDGGFQTDFVIQDSTRMLRAEPGAKDLKEATPIVLTDLQTGDRVLVRGTPAADGKAILAVTVVVIKATDVAAKQQLEREDWQKRGMGGLVTSLDASAGTVTISTSTMAGTKSTIIHVSKDTVVRRYSPDSVKFDDAKPGTLDQIKVGDQLRARGTKSADGNELTAEEIVSGTFRNIAGLVISTNPADNSVSVQDLASKKPVVLKISSDSQMRNLPDMVAQRIAARLKGSPSGSAALPSGQGAPAQGQMAHAGGAAGPGGRPGGGGDFQQMLNRMPAVTLADLQKGNAVMIVATEGSPGVQPTAVTLLTGVEPILTASPDSSRAAMLLSPWNLGGTDAAAGGPQ